MKFESIVGEDPAILEKSLEKANSWALSCSVNNNCLTLRQHVLWLSDFWVPRTTSSQCCVLYSSFRVLRESCHTSSHVVLMPLAALCFLSDEPSTCYSFLCDCHSVSISMIACYSKWLVRNKRFRCTGVWHEHVMCPADNLVKYSIPWPVCVFKCLCLELCSFLGTLHS